MIVYCENTIYSLINCFRDINFIVGGPNTEAEKYTFHLNKKETLRLRGKLSPKKVGRYFFVYSDPGKGALPTI